MSALFPHVGALADDLCVIRSMTTEQINHDTAHAFMNTGSIIKGRPSMGSWMLYGLGAEASNLPGYVVMTSSGPGATASFSTAVERGLFAQQVPRGRLPVERLAGALHRQPRGRLPIDPAASD